MADIHHHHHLSSIYSAFAVLEASSQCQVVAGIVLVGAENKIYISLFVTSQGQREKRRPEKQQQQQQP